jgi:hypothetical protein
MLNCGVPGSLVGVHESHESIVLASDTLAFRADTDAGSTGRVRMI